MRKPLIAVIMATYNGDKFLIEQLDSILNQKNVNVHLYISDDGSTDQTISIIKKYFRKYPNQFKRLFHNNYGHPAKNFLSIFSKLNSFYSYYAFSDQDDIWLPDKLIHAVKIINLGADLYCGRTKIIDNNLKHLGYSNSFKHKPCFKNALVQSIAGSNTFLFNHEVYKLLLKSSNLNLQVPMHDWWTYLVTAFCGKKIFFDKIPKVLYRQHANNVNGFNLGLKNQLKRIILALSGRYKNWNNLNEKNLLFFIDQATKKNLDVFNQFVYLRKNYGILNFRKAKKLGIFREKFISNFYLDLGFLLGKV